MSKIHAEIRGQRMTVSRTRFRRGDSWMHWYLQIVDTDGTVLYDDDCRDLGKLHDQAARCVDAFRRVAFMGQTFRSWTDIVDDVRENF